MPTPVCGTVLAGTMKPQDLIPAFLAELEFLDQEQMDLVATDPLYILSQEKDDDDEWWDSEEAGYFLDELFAKLNALAPEGCFFGAHPGDGADYGFWPVEG